MNLTRSRHPSNTCACNSCVFKREGIGNGSRIDKLYHNQYLPLRERKLLDKLVRTRGVYDDVRNRILSLSSVDIAKDPELKDSENFPGSDTDVNATQIQKLVELIDRGEFSPLQSPVHFHSDCCGCCICSSKSRINKQGTNRYKVHMHIPEKKHIDRYVESHRYKMRKDIRNVGFKAAKSDPCLCTLKFSKIPQKPKHVVNKRRFQDNVNSEKRAKKIPLNIKCECNFEAAEESLSKKSVELFKNAENKVKNSIRSTVTKIENVFHIKKDSLMIFRDKLKKKQEMKAWQCDPNFCMPNDNECNPDECYEKVKRREANKMKLRAHHYKMSDTRKRQRVKQTQSPMQRPEPHNNRDGFLSFPRECEPFMCIPRECDPRDCTKILLKSSPAGHELQRCFCTEQMKYSRSEKQQILRINKPKKKPKLKKKSTTTMTKRKTKVICECEVTDSAASQTKRESQPKMLKKESYSVETVPVPVVAKRKAHDLLPYECEPSFCAPGECNPLVCEERIKNRHQRIKITSNDTNAQDIQQKSKMSRHNIMKSKPNQNKPEIKNEPRKQAVRISSSFKFDIEFIKEKIIPDALDNTNMEHTRHKERSVQNNVKYREPIKRSVSEGILNHKDVQNRITPTPKTPLTKEQASQDTFLKRCFCTLKLHKIPKQKPIPKRPKSKMTMTKKEMKENIEQVLCKCKNIDIDCLCEPQDDVTSTKSQVSMTTGISYVIPPTSLTHNLLPYECEPLFCIPGKCNPLVCDKQIQMRKIPKTLSKEINTESKKSTRTITSKSATPYSEKKVQIPKRKKTKTKAEIKKEPHKKPLADKSKSAPNAPRKQAVKISSSFRFDIEFYKDMTPPNDDTHITSEKTFLSGKPKIKEKLRRKSISVDNNGKIKSTLTMTEPLKRCFCTLKFMKNPKQKVKKSLSKKVMTIKNEERASNMICDCTSISTQTKNVKPSKPKEISKVFVKPPIPQSGLLPYECEPNVCIPGQCDPFICDERIKARNRREVDRAPLLKRCFCTLKFHNDNNTKRNGIVIPLQNNLEITSMKSIGTDTKNNKIQHKNGMYKLLPNECEPGVCEPGRCDPYECLKLIKKRNMYDTSKHKAKYVNTEVPKVKNVQSEIKYVNKEKSQVTTLTVTEDEYASEIEKHSETVPVTPAKSRQSIKMSSEFSFNVEFRKSKSERSINNKRIKVKPKIGVKLTKEKSTKATPHKRITQPKETQKKKRHY